jgi:SHS2 domain-containing protein
MTFEFLEHTADIKFRARGSTLNGAFAEAAHAFSYYVSRGKKIQMKKKKKFSLEAIDYGNLLYNFLDELIYLIDAEHFIVGKATVKIDETSSPMKLTAVLEGDDTSHYSDLDSVKAATYAEMSIREIADEWEVQAVLDV